MSVLHPLRRGYIDFCALVAKRSKCLFFSLNGQQTTKEYVPQVLFSALKCLRTTYNNRVLHALKSIRGRAENITEQHWYCTTHRVRERERAFVSSIVYSFFTILGRNLCVQLGNLTQAKATQITSSILDSSHRLFHRSSLTSHFAC